MDISRIAPPPPFKALIFDCDGTLADTMPAHAVEHAIILEKVTGLALRTDTINPATTLSPIIDKHCLHKHGADAYYGVPKS